MILTLLCQELAVEPAHGDAARSYDRAGMLDDRTMLLVENGLRLVFGLI
jgi:hypothetical protein